MIINQELTSIRKINFNMEIVSLGRTLFRTFYLWRIINKVTNMLYTEKGIKRKEVSFNIIVLCELVGY